MADKKISELTAITGADTAADDFFIVVDTSGSATKKISRAELNNAIEQDVLAQVDITSANIDGGTIDNTPIGSTTASTGAFTTVDTTGDVTVGGNLTVQGTTVTIDTATTQTVDLGDNDKIRLGDANDLEIYHNSTASENIIDANSGTLVLRSPAAGTIEFRDQGSQVLAQFNDNSDVKLYYNNNLRASTTSSGIDVTGTVTADTEVRIDGDSPSVYLMESDTTDVNTRIRNSNGDFIVDTVTDNKSTLTNRLRIDHASGDISFYDSTGVTQGLYWDASTQRLGLGTTAPEGDKLHIQASDNNNDDDLIALGFTFDANSKVLGTIGVHNSASNTGGLKFSTKDSGTLAERMRITSGGGVGIGTSTVNSDRDLHLHTNDSGSVFIQVTNSTTGTGSTDGLIVGVDASENALLYHYENKDLYFGTNNAERMRVDSSGNVAIGTTATGGAKFKVDGGATAGSIIQAGNAQGGVILGAESSVAYVNTTSSTPLAFEINNSEAMRVDSSGNVGIGVTSVLAKLHVDDTNSAFYMGYGGNEDIYLQTTNGNVLFTDKGATTERMRITSGGNVGIGTASPAYNLDVYNSASTGAPLLAQFKSAGGDTQLYVDNSTITTQLTADATNSAGIVGTKTNHPFVFRTNNAERMRLDSSGRLGISTSSPSQALHVVGEGLFEKTSADSVVSLTSTGGSGRSYQIRSQTSGDFYIYDNTAGSARVVVASDGDIYFGTTSKVYNSNEFISVDAPQDGIGINSPFACLLLTKPTFTNPYFVAFGDASQNVIGSITSGGTSVAYNTSSDYRLKENVTEVTGAADRVKALNPVRFNFIADPDTTVDGFLAHEVADVVPEAISGTKDAMRDEEYEVTPAVLDDEGNVVTEAVMGTRSVPDYQGIDQSKLVPLLTAALQEALTKIDDLETRLAALEAN